ncbi:MAG: hypothetical protein ACTHN5_08020 [Phycisphaerae bacterium]
MTTFSSFPDARPHVMTYCLSDTPRVRYPHTATLGFLFFSLFFLNAPLLFVLQQCTHAPWRPLCGLCIDVALRSAMLLGALLILSAFRRSTALPRKLHAALTLATCLYALSYLVFLWFLGLRGWVLYDAYGHWAGLLCPMLSTTTDAVSLGFTLLWFVFLTRLACDRGSCPMIAAAILFLGARVLFLAAWILLEADCLLWLFNIHVGNLLPKVSPLFQALRYTDILLPPALFALFLWYARAVHSLAAAPNP